MSTASSGGPGGAAGPSAPPPLPPPLHGTELLIGTVALSLATFMNVLDTSIANVSIPAIAGDNGVSPTQGTWVITSFAVANAISVPLSGWLAQRFGQVRVFVTATLLFTVASLLCALSPNLQMLIVFRVLQGLVAGPMIPLSQSLLLASYPAARAGTALALWSVTTLVAPIVGPPLGGWISDNLNWPWIFYINIPVGLLAAWAGWIVYHRRESTLRKLPVDFIGLVLLVVWVGAMQITLDKGRELDWFNSGEIIALAAVAVVGFVFFLIWELTDEHPVVDLTLFGRRNFAIGATTLAIAYGLFFGNVVLLPLWLQQYMGYTATTAGLALAPVGFLAILLSPWVGRNVRRRDPRLLAGVAFVVFAIVLTMRSHFSTDDDYFTIVLPSLVQGVALAFLFVPLTSILLSGLPPERLPAASGLSNFFRMTAGAFGTSVTTTLWDSRAQAHHEHLAAQISDYGGNAGQVLSQLGAAGMPREQALPLINRLIDVQAYTLGADELFHVSALLFLALVLLILFARPGQGAGGAPATSDAH